VLGAKVAQALFGNTSPIGREVRVNSGGPGGGRSVLLQVIGAGQAKGGTGFDNPGTEVYLPLTTAMEKLARSTSGAGAETVSQVSVKAVDAQHVNSLEQEITAVLMQRHHLSDPTQLDFSVVSQQDQMQTRQRVTSVLTILLAAVAGISLLVGGIGIMNIMIASVAERTHEIGLRKAVGARHADTLEQFLPEALILSTLGGLGGIVVGVALARLVDGVQLHGQALQTHRTVPSMLLAAGVPAAVGALFGSYPAEQEARLQPIEALRYE
jgi:putative ABC transport system permease protein